MKCYLLNRELACTLINFHLQNFCAFNANNTLNYKTPSLLKE
jgi:hypothetical protein